MTADEAIKDADHEARIALAMREYYASTDQPEHVRVELWGKVAKLIAQRSPRKVAAMEQARGIS